MKLEEYDRMQSALALLKIIQLAEADVREGRTVPQDQAFRRIESIIEDARRSRKRSDC